MKLTPKQYVALQSAQAQVAQAQTNLRQVMELLGLEVEKPYTLNPDKAVIVVQEIGKPVRGTPAQVDNQPTVE